jgi:Uma2 family endonuclease
MSKAALVTVQEYLATSYRPDCDYVDGVLIERNVGTRDHSLTHGEVFAWFRDRRAALKLAALPGQRLGVSSTRYRIPDVCVVQRPVPSEAIFASPPYICVEILSPDDTFRRMQDRVDDYLGMGVENVWIIDPESQRAWWVTGEGHCEALDRVLRTRDGIVVLPIADLFMEESES